MALKAANADLIAGINRSEINELRAMSRPPPSIHRLLFALYFLQVQLDDTDDTVKAPKPNPSWLFVMNEVFLPGNFNRLGPIDPSTVTERQLQELDKVYPLALLEVDPFQPPIGMFRSMANLDMWLSNLIKQVRSSPPSTSSRES